MTTSRLFSLGLNIALYLVLPMLGVLLWGWDWRMILVLYWLDNITVGGLTVISLARRRRETPSMMHPAFFLLHYGIFTTVHGVFVFVLVAALPSFSDGMPTPPSVDPLQFVPVLVAWMVGTVIQWGVAVFSPTPFSDGIGKAYVRMIVLHLTIIFGMFLIMFLGLPGMVVAILLVVLRALGEAAFAGIRAVGSRVRETIGARLGEAGGGSGWTMEQTGPGRWEARRVLRTSTTAQSSPQQPDALD